jgi:Transposase DDE domain
LRRLAEVLPDDVQVTLLAGFADTKLFGFLDELGFGYVIRLKGNIKVTTADGPTRPAAEGQGGRARKLRDATEAQCPVGAVVCVHAKAMKEPWCLVASDGSATAPQIVTLYTKRWKVEPSFRDTKDLRFGLSSARISDPQRRDRLLLLNAFAVVLLTLLGAAGESLGMISSQTPSTLIPCSAKAVCFTT